MENIKNAQGCLFLPHTTRPFFTLRVVCPDISFFFILLRFDSIFSRTPVAAAAAALCGAAVVLLVLLSAMHHHPGSHSFFFAGPRAPPPRAGPWHPHHQHQHQHRHPSQPQQFALGTPSSQQASGPWQPPEFEIFVGKSPHSNMKVVHLPRPGLAVSNLPINPQEEHWKDRFDVSVEGEQLTVNRVDGGTGWRQPLRLRAWVAGSDAAFEPIAQSPRIVARSEGKVRPPQSLHPDHDNAPTRPWTQEPEPDQVLGEGGPLLHSGVYGVPQTWSQEPHGYQRRVHVHVRLLWVDALSFHFPPLCNNDGQRVHCTASVKC